MPVFAVAESVARIDEKDNVFPRKETKNSMKKIDAAVAAIMVNSRLHNPVDQPVTGTYVSDTQGILML